MISFLAYTKSENELTLLKQTVTDISSILSDEDLKMYGFSSRDKFEKFLQNCPVLDISCVDVCENGGIDYAKKVRSTNQNMSILLIVDLSLSPATYIIPSIMAGSLLIRPFDRTNAKNVLDTIFKDYYRHFEKEDGSKSFVVETREGKRLVPYSGIVYFESRDKKIFLGTDNEEYSFYGTLDKLEESLDDRFIRCHRSFIAAKKRISKIVLSKNIVVLDNGCEIPLSRSYKGKVKEAIQL